MATVDELVTRAAKTGLYDEKELTTFRAALGPSAKPEEKESALDGLMAKLELAAAKNVPVKMDGGTVVDPGAARAAGAPATAVSTVASPVAGAVTTDAWLATAPLEVQSVVRDAMAQRAAVHAQTVAVVRVAALAAGYTEEQLQAMPVEDLRRLAALAKVETTASVVPTIPVDFSGAGVVVHNQYQAGYPNGLRAAVVRPPNAWEDAIKEEQSKQKAN